MAEKDSGRYRYEPYPPLTTKQNNGGSSTLKKLDPPTKLKVGSPIKDDSSGSGGGGGDGGDGGGSGGCCCNCMNPKATSFWVGLITNLGICTLLLAYTLLGMFLEKRILITQFLCSATLFCIYL